MKIKPITLAFTIAIFIFGGIGISSLTGLWKTTSTKIPAKYAVGEYEGSYNPADIRGSYTFGDISKYFEIPLEDLGKAFGIEDETGIAEFQCKELEEMYSKAKAQGMEVGTDSVRTFVALYKGLPFELGEAYLLDTAIAILKSKGELTPQQIEYLNTHTLKQAESNIQTENIQQNTNTASNGDYNSEDRLVKGKTTFNEVISWGVSIEEIESILGKKIGNHAMTVRDYCSQNGIEFSGIKAALQTIIDKK